MNKKAEGAMFIPLFVIIFTASVVLISLIFFVVPGKEGITQQKREISSDIDKAEIYPNTISQINFARSSYKGDKVSNLIRAFYSKKDAATKLKLDNAATNYVDMYTENCVDMILMNKEKEVLWQSKFAPGCKDLTYFATAMKNKVFFKADVIVPTENPDDYIIIQQRSIVVK
jgi:hypothetical protein